MSLGMYVARGLAHSTKLESEVVWIEGIDRNCWRSWEVFFRAFARERAASPLIDPFMIGASIPTGLAVDDKIYAFHSWEGALSRVDTALFVSEGMQRRPPSFIDPRVLDSIIVELAGWNLDLARHLLDASTDDLLDPIPWLKHEARGSDGEVPNLSRGTSEMWDGVNFACSRALAARNDELVLRLRLWRAHLTAVFPWLEEVRLMIVDAHRERLARSLPSSTAWGEVVEQPEDLELGHILHLIRHRLEPDLLAFLERCKRMRDGLAHRDPVDAEDLREAYRYRQTSPMI